MRDVYSNNGETLDLVIDARTGGLTTAGFGYVGAGATLQGNGVLTGDGFSITTPTSAYGPVEIPGSGRSIGDGLGGPDVPYFVGGFVRWDSFGTFEYHQIFAHSNAGGFFYIQTGSGNDCWLRSEIWETAFSGVIGHSAWPVPGGKAALIGAWHFLAMRYDGSKTTAGIEYFIDGTKHIPGGAGSITGAADTSALVRRYGNRFGGGGRGLQGKHALQVEKVGRLVTDAEVQQIRIEGQEIIGAYL